MKLRSITHFNVQEMLGTTKTNASGSNLCASDPVSDVDIGRALALFVGSVSWYPNRASLVCDERAAMVAGMKSLGMLHTATFLADDKQMVPFIRLAMSGTRFY